MTSPLAEQDKRHLWHPFTQMQEWCAPDHDPLVLVSGDGAILRDEQGREYIDGNSSIWTNLHGHNHPRLNAAITDQLQRVAHTSFLGFTNDRAIELAGELLELFPGKELTRVFYSDNGSTAIELAIKMVVQYWQLIGRRKKRRFVAFHNAYHGDTMGASSLGGVRLFHERFATHQFPVDHVRDLSELEALGATDDIAAVVIEPIIQGVNGMRPWPAGMLADLRGWCDEHDVKLIADEIMTGFGRTGTLFACEHEGVVPDFVALAKGISGGTMPLAATLIREEIYAAFLGTFEEQKTFYYGHSYTGNPLACAAGLASLAIFRDERVLEKLQDQIVRMQQLLSEVAGHPQVAEIRQCGFIAGIEVMRAPGRGVAYEPSERMGNAICLAARRHGLLTRPIGDVIVLMPPYCTTDAQLVQAVNAIHSAIDAVC